MAPALPATDVIDWLLTGDSFPATVSARNRWPSEIGARQATLNTTPAPVPGATLNSQKTVQFAQSTNWYRIPVTGTDMMTCAFVVTIVSDSAEQVILDGDSTAREYTAIAASTPRFLSNRGGTGSYNVGSVLDPGAHVILTAFDGNTLRVWIDGILSSVLLTQGAQATTLRIGTNNYDGGTRRFKGAIGALARWPTLLTDSQISDASGYFADRYGVVLKGVSAAGTVGASGTALKRAGKLLAGSTEAAGTLARRPARMLAGALTSAGSVRKSALRTMRSTVALFSLQRTDVKKIFRRTFGLSGSTHARKLSVVRRRVRAVELLGAKWHAFTQQANWNAEVIQRSAWHLTIEGSPVIAGSIEEVRVGVSYVFGDAADLPESVQVQIGSGEWKAAELTTVSATRCIATLLVGPLVRGTYPIHVRFASGVETPILYAGSLAVL